MISGVSLLAKTAFFNDVIIRLCHHSVVCASIDGIFYNFSVTRIVGMIRDKNYEKLSKFVKVTT